MRTKKFLAFMAMGIIALAQVGCGEKGGDEVKPTPTGITLNNDTIEVAVESVATLVANLEPAGAEGTVTWSTSDKDIANVTANGVVTGVKVGEATITATVGAFTDECVVNVTAKPLDPNAVPAALTGTNYHLIHLDGQSYELIKDKVVNDMRPDEINKFLYIWEDTFTAGTSVGTNFAGAAEGWISFIVGGKGWSGAGWNYGQTAPLADMTDLFNNPEDYVFHAAFKSTEATSTYVLGFEAGSTKVQVAIGSADFDDNGVITEKYADFPRDGEWHSIEIPMTHLKDLGLLYSQPFNNKNVFFVLAGGRAGTTFDMDGAFFYKPAK